jgi:peptidoglycan/LPS O-acetylase OafA/YrhL
LRRETSTYLDGVRFLAALVVFLGHLAGKRFTGGLLWPVSAFMGDAVTIFFVLSGYVIAYVSDTNERTLSSYTVNRIARIYSVAVPALLLTFVLDTIGRHLQPALYSADWGFSNDHAALRYLSALSFTDELWWNHLDPGSLLPYWSLGYEVWYYMIFAAFWFCRGYPRYFLTVLFSIIAGPKILALFPIWLIGFATYHMARNLTIPRRLSALILALTGMIVVAAFLWVAHTGKFPSDSRLVSYGVGLVFAISILAVEGLGNSAALLLPVAKPVRWLAGMTFSLYLFHLPVAQFLATIIPWGPQAPLTRVTIVAGTLLAVCLLAQLTERKKAWWRGCVAAMLAVIERGANIRQLAGWIHAASRRRRAAV